MKDKMHNMNSVIKNHKIEVHVMGLEPWLWNRSSEEWIPCAGRISWVGVQVSAESRWNISDVQLVINWDLSGTNCELTTCDLTGLSIWLVLWQQLLCQCGQWLLVPIIKTLWCGYCGLDSPARRAILSLHLSIQISANNSYKQTHQWECHGAKKILNQWLISGSIMDLQFVFIVTTITAAIAITIVIAIWIFLEVQCRTVSMSLRVVMSVIILDTVSGHYVSWIPWAHPNQYPINSLSQTLHWLDTVWIYLGSAIHYYYYKNPHIVAGSVK